EAGCDLARLAGCEPASVIVEILKEDGTMARRPDLEVFAKLHDIKMGTIADLIEYRNANETTIVKEAQCKLPTKYGEFDLVTYRDTIDDQLHYAMVKGAIDKESATTVRVHLQNTFNDLLASERAQNRSWPLDKAMARIAKDGGVLVLLANNETNDSLLAQLKVFELEDKGEKAVAAKWQGTSRRVGVGSQILADLGIGKMNLLSSPKRYHALSGFGLEVVEYISE
ncbi:MAG: 3,4-dihydroxy-2-butanone-4-phosphate synthase, partial [Psychrobium sp.]|nr:3,4-dihydroxy-2-butanone-4-phosphate synthase [Psychrobium sp.]